jgi:nucleoside recognition membrane protein YjiH
MTVNPISAASLGQYVLSTSNATQLQQTLQTLQNSLASGDLTGAQSVFQAVQTLYQNSLNASGTSQSSTSQVSTDLAALGSALTSGDLTTAQSVFATVQADLKPSTSPSQITEAIAASQSLALVDELLSTLNQTTAASSITDNTNAILQSVYGNQSSLSVLA